jgi:hypothetical protein
MTADVPAPQKSIRLRARSGVEVGVATPRHADTDRDVAICAEVREPDEQIWISKK